MREALDRSGKEREAGRALFVGRLAVAALAWTLAACAARRDPRTPDELKRDAEVWTRAKQLHVVSGTSQVLGCKSLGVVSEQYFEDPPSDPLKRPAVRSWPEHVLRYKTARLGGDTAYLCPTIRTWSGELNESRVLGEAYHCTPPTVASLPDSSSARDTR